MAFADPQSITFNGVATSFARISSRENSSKYNNSDSSRRLLLSSSYGKRIRRVARIDDEKRAADPLFPTQNRPYSTSFYVVADLPEYGYTNTELAHIGAGLMTWLTASSNANFLRLLNGEN